MEVGEEPLALKRALGLGFASWSWPHLASPFTACSPDDGILRTDASAVVEGMQWVNGSTSIEASKRLAEV